MMTSFRQNFSVRFTSCLLLLPYAALAPEIASDGMLSGQFINSYLASSHISAHLSNLTYVSTSSRDALMHESNIPIEDTPIPIDDTPIPIEDVPTNSLTPPTALETPPIALKGPPTDQSPVTMHILIENRLPVNDKFIVRPMGSNLILTCIVNGSDLTEADRGRSSGMLAIRWYIPLASGHSDSRVTQHRSRDSVQLTISRLRNEDSGNFSCGVQLSDGRSLLKSFKLNVRPGCVTSEFQCLDNTCIPRVYKCDSHPDCPDGSDETLNTCGEVVSCSSALSSSASMFSGGDAVPAEPELLSCGKRCWPRYFCCFQANCSSSLFINQEQPCCRDLRDSYHRNILNGLDRDKTNIVYHRKYLETAIYTIIGCAVAFILIVSVMIVAFCRVHLRQSAHLSSYSHVRSSQLRHTAAASAGLEADHMLLPPAAPLFDPSFGQAGSRLVVTYNINNGIQVLPCVSPPSYSEAVGVAAAPPPPAAARPSADTTTTTTTANHPVHNAAPVPPAVSPGAGSVPAAVPASVLHLVGPPPPYSSCETLALPCDPPDPVNQVVDTVQSSSQSPSPPPLT